MQKKILILTDTSVIISALNSYTGASWLIVYLAQKNHIEITVSNYIITETEEVLKRKFPKLKARFNNLKNSGTLHLTEDPPLSLIDLASRSIDDPKDVPIVAAALSSGANYLITLDKKDFINNSKISQETSLTILLPGEFIQMIRLQKH